jgi:hypothetical protein
METIKTTTNRVEISQTDLATWFLKNVKDIKQVSVKIVDSTTGEEAFWIGVPVSVSYMDAFLRNMIPSLPTLGNYKYQILPHATDVVGVITWTN